MANRDRSDSPTFSDCEDDKSPDEGNGDGDYKLSPEPDVQKPIVRAPRNANPQAMTAPVVGPNSQWAVVCAIGRFLWLLVRAVVYVCKLPVKLFTFEFPDEFFGYRSRWWCRKTRGGQPVPEHPNDKWAALFWIPFVSTVSGLLIFSLVYHIETPAKRQSLLSYALEQMTGYGEKAFWIIWWETISSAVGMRVFTTLLLSFPLGVMSGFGMYCLGVGSFSDYANGIAGFGNFALGLRSCAWGEVKDVLYSLALMLFSLGTVVGQRSRRIAMFMCCCYEVRPKPGRHVAFQEVGEAVLSSTTKANITRTLMAAVGSRARKFANALDGGRPSEYSYDPTIGHSVPLNRVRQEGEPNEYDVTMGHSFSHLKPSTER